MVKRNNALILSLRDMDIGSFVRYDIKAGSLTARLFGIFTLKTISLRGVLLFRQAIEADITPLNRINWFSFIRPQTLSPVYTLQATENSPRIFMRLDRGSHSALRCTLEQIVRA